MPANKWFMEISSLANNQLDSSTLLNYLKPVAGGGTPMTVYICVEMNQFTIPKYSASHRFTYAWCNVSHIAQQDTVLDATSLPNQLQM